MREKTLEEKYFFKFVPFFVCQVMIEKFKNVEPIIINHYRLYLSPKAEIKK